MSAPTVTFTRHCLDRYKERSGIHSDDCAMRKLVKLIERAEKLKLPERGGVTFWISRGWIIVINAENVAETIYHPKDKFTTILYYKEGNRAS